jgi:phage-related minor tail protein
VAKPIVIKITGNTKGLQKAIGKSQGMLSSFGLNAKKALAGGIVAGGALAAKALFDVGVMAQEMESIIVKGTGASGDALADLVESSRDVLASVPDSSEMVAGALADVNTFFGETGTKLEDTSELFLDFARLTGTDVTASVAAMDAAMTQFGNTDSIDENLGDLARISQASGIEMGKLQEQMATFGPVFANAGFTLEETAATIGQLKTAGVDLTRVGPALNAFFRKTADAGKDPQQAIKSITETIKGATTDTAALNIATEAFGSEGAQRMVSAIRSGNFDLEDFNGLLGDGAGLVDAQTVATESFGDKWNTIKNQVFVKVMPIAERLFDVLLKGMDDLGPMVAKVVAWFKADLWPEIQTVMAEIEIVIADVVATVTEIWDRWGEDIMAVAKVAFTFIMETVKATLRIIKGIFNTFAGLLTGDWSRMWDGIKDIVGGVFDRIVAQIKAVPALILALWPMFKAAGKSLGTGIMDGIKSGLSAIGGFVSDIGKAVWRSVKSIINTKIIDRINVGIPNKLGKGPFSIDLPNNPVPRLAFGGDVIRSGPVMVGERGPEVLNLPKGSSVTANHEGGGMSSGVTVNVATNANAADIGREIAWIMNTGGI